jgi:type VI secretion system secreted protein VgrG
MAVGFTQDNQNISVDTPLGKDALLLKAVDGEEQISGLFRFELEMLSEDPNLDFASIVSEAVTVNIGLSDEENVRYINGLVTEFSQHDFDARVWIYRAVIRPSMWLLTRTTDCRIFQNQSVMDIIEAIFGDYGITDYRNDTKSTYAEREYCVQYNETAFNFVSRLMEDEGIFYFFDHEDAKHTLVLADDADSHQKCPGLHAATYQPSQPEAEQEDVVFAGSYAERVVSDKYATDDFNFETPSTELYVNAEGAGSGSDMQVYEYPGGYIEKGVGEGRANLRLAEFELPVKKFSGRSYCRPMIAGYTFPLIEHDRDAYNRDYVIRRLRIHVTRDSYENSFEAFPDDVSFRTPRLTPKPRIHGTQTAIVTGKSGEEIWTDEYGRIKVQFHWDQRGEKDENSSCWIRVSQGWAGKNWGSWFLHRIGHEVVVSFLNGDPDRPMVTGAVYNGEMPQPYALPGEQTKSTIKSDSSKGGDGFNEIRLEDKKDEEEIYVHAQKDQNITVENDRFKEVLNDETIEVTQNRTATIKEGDEALTVEKGNRTVAVQTGTEKHSVEGTRDVSVTGDESHSNDANYDWTVAGDFTKEVTGNYTLKVSGDLAIEVTGAISIKGSSSITTEAATSYANKAGTAFDNEAGTALTNKAGTALNNEAGTDLTNKAGMNLKNDAGMNLDNKAGMNLTDDAGLNMTSKGGLMGSFEGSVNGTLKGGAMAQVSGGMVKLG